MPSPLIGVANSISRNFQFDPLDTLKFAKQGNFDIVQIYLTGELLDQPKVLSSLRNSRPDFQKIYFHAENYLNETFLKSDYRHKLYQFLDTLQSPSYIIHFDENAGIDDLIKLVEVLSKENYDIYVENYFQASGKEAAERNLKKYLALFTLSGSFGNTIYPVLDIPRLFHKKLAFSEEESLEWCYQMINFFGNRRIPLLLHLIDAKSADQPRSQYTTIGRGYIPYQQIFQFMVKTRPKLAGIILEFEDKINPLQSREYIRHQFTAG